jgi:hypothetical protein
MTAARVRMSRQIRRSRLKSRQMTRVRSTMRVGAERGVVSSGFVDLSSIGAPAADKHWYLYYWHNNTGQRTVNLRRSPTPLNLSSWELVVAGLPWHRNGCALPNGPGGKNYVIFGETYGSAYPGLYLPGIGIATTDDWVSYDVVNDTWMEPSGTGPEQEMGIEASTPPIKLSTGESMIELP